MILFIRKKKAFEVAEWLGTNFVRIANKVWIRKYSDQRKKENWKTTKQLYQQWKKMKRNERKNKIQW